MGIIFLRHSLDDLTLRPRFYDAFNVFAGTVPRLAVEYRGINE